MSHVDSRNQLIAFSSFNLSERNRDVEMRALRLPDSGKAIAQVRSQPRWDLVYMMRSV